ncbi:beta-galactosidase [Herbiconiux sp. P17]|uniref:beta-galactosidase n=1 Tax=Herbiconiux wuyangfengii TaxID=3342794 RepID=UPI0035B93C16
MSQIPRIPTGRRLPWPVEGLAFGGDYNPEQWPEEVWPDDVRLMREAGVTMVTLGVFSWGALETAEGVFDFDWLDRVIGLLHDAGIVVDLATPTASPPIWLHQAHREILPVSRSGERYWQGGRLGWCPSSPVFREYALRIVGELGRRYGTHPAVRLWHVSNELGGGNRHCYCDESARHFREWLGERYGEVAALNQAWGTAFWGHQYSSFEQVLPPRDSESAPNPALVLDFDRFSSDALLAHYLAERDVLRAFAPETPITTNFMVAQGPGVVDHASWAPHVDVLANDHYSLSVDPNREEELAFSGDRMRGLDPEHPWLVMEHSTSAVNWQARNRSKEPGELIRNSLTHIARGSDGALFFQWRASTAGAEQFHSAMLPHAGTRTKVWRDVCELGRILGALSEVRGTLVEPAAVALVYGDVAGWAWNSGQKPHHDLPPSHAVRDYHLALWEHGVTADIVPPGASLDRYRLVVVPALFLADDETAAAVTRAVEAGATVVVTYLSGIVDETDRVRAGGYPGAFRELLGVFVEEFFVLLDDETVDLDTGWRATTWSEFVHADDAEVVALYASGPLAGHPAVTRRRVGGAPGAGSGEAWYVSARLDHDSLAAFTVDLLAAAGVVPTVPVASGLEAVRRVGPGGSYLFAINHSREPVTVPARGFDLVSGTAAEGELTIPAGGVAVLREGVEA